MILTTRLRRDLASWLPTLIGPLEIQSDGVAITPRRATLNFRGGQVEDNPDNDSTDIGPFTAIPGGQPGELQVHYVDGEEPTLRGTPKLHLEDPDDPSSEVVHTGTPIHLEDEAVFRVDGSTSGSEARSKWKEVDTSDATPTVVAEIMAADATFGDCFISVLLEVTYAYASSGTKGGKLSVGATFERSSGTLSRVGLKVTKVDDLIEGTDPGGVDIDINGDDQIDVTVTGIAATDIRWFGSLHIQLVTVPS